MTDRKQPTYAIIGAGAIGGYYGALLIRSGREVHVLLHSDYDHVREHGLVVESVKGDFKLPFVNAYQSVATMPKCDVVIVALKATQNHLLPSLLPSLLHDGSVVVMLQNGLGAEEEVAACVGAHRVMGGLCFICSNKVGPGHICHLDFGDVTIGAFQAAQPGAEIAVSLQEIGREFESAGITVHLTDNLALARWKKLVWNVPNSGLSVVLNTTTTEIVLDPAGRAVAIGLMEEVIAGAAACGQFIDPDIIPQMLKTTESMIPYRPSMKIDYDEKRPMEIEAIYGNPLKAAAKAGVELPRISMLCEQLRFLERKNRAE